MGRDLVGRDAELDLITALLSRAARGSTASCVIEGGIGIGKTALWNAALDFAAQHGFLVLKAHPAEAETAFSFAALADILRPKLGEALAVLPPPQRRALETALLIDTEAAGGSPDPHAVSVAVLTSLEHLAKKQPLIVAVDDVQWLDSPSRAALQFVARRLGPRMVLLATERDPDAGAPTFPVEGERMRLGPLSAGALQQLVQTRIGIALPRPILLRLHEASGGYPFYALEISRALLASGSDLSAAEPLPVPGNLRQLVARRLALISSTTRRELIAVAASARPAPDLLSEGALREAIDSEVLVIDGERLRFSHPLLGSVLYADASVAERRVVHETLAGLVSDEEEAARHLALAAHGPDEHVALLLDRAAAHAAVRGAPTAAAELMERAYRLTPQERTRDRLRRAVDEAGFRVAARMPGAEQLLVASLPGTSGNLRARALLLLAFVRGNSVANTAQPLLEEALEHVDDPLLELRIRLELVNPVLRGVDDRTAVHVERAVALAERNGDAALMAIAVASRAALRDDPIADLERAAKMEERGRGSVQARFQLALLRLRMGSDAGRLLLNALLGESSSAGNRAHNWVIGTLSYAETRAGNPLRGKQLASEFLQYAVPEHNRLAECFGLGVRAYAEAVLGVLDDARRDAEESMRIADAASFAGRSIQACSVLGFIELSTGAVGRAAEYLDQSLARHSAADTYVWPLFAQSRLAIPNMVADAVECLVGLGRIEEAHRVLTWLERDPRNPWNRALSAHCRGLLAAARGDQEQAQADLGAAAERLEPLSLPLDFGRALLALGGVQRRLQHKAEARRSLERALAVFERIGAPFWAAKAQEELGRIGGRQTAAGLTASERRVAELVATGRSNKEVAAALFISPKTVEGHLANVFAKLGVSSRTELARKVASEKTPTP